MKQREVLIALVGNPNVGKSTVFNALTGARQHTGNWTGKTVDVASGSYDYKGSTYTVVDLPGTYSLAACSEEERITSDYIRSGVADYVVVVLDGTCMERNLAFALRIMQVFSNVILCINLLDEATRSGIEIDVRLLSGQLGVPVVGISAKDPRGINELREKIRNVADGFCQPIDRPAIKNKEPNRLSKELCQICVKGDKKAELHWFDKIILKKYCGSIVLVASLFLILWLTISGANYLTALLEYAFVTAGKWLNDILILWPGWISGLLVEGVYGTVTKVVAAMFPPLIIFFPLFTLLEDLGFLPRAAFMLDKSLEHCGSCGKQILTMSMGLGCNSVGVMGARIISSKRERLLAILTNSLIPCNGKFPTLLILSGLYFSNNSFSTAVILTALLLLSMGVTLLSTRILSGTLLKGNGSCFIMELPPYRRPGMKKILSHAVVDRVVFVLLRAIMVAAPTGIILWLVHHITIGEQNAMAYLASWMDPFASLLGMSGVILLAFVLSFPANELFLPIVCIGMSGSFGFGFELSGLRQMLMEVGFTWKHACCTIIFLLFHWPCSTTCLTIHKETGSWKWTAAAMILPTVIGVAICIAINQFIN